MTRSFTPTRAHIKNLGEVITNLKGKWKWAQEVGPAPLEARRQRGGAVSGRSRFVEEGLAKLVEVRKGRGRKPSIGSQQVEQIVHDTLHGKPKGETHWSTSSIARHAKVSRSTVQRIWRARELKPHRVDTFKTSGSVTRNTG